MDKFILIQVITVILFLIVLWQENTKYIRIIISIILLVWLIYSIFFVVYINILFEGFMFFLSILAILKKDILKNKPINILDKLKIMYYRRQLYKMLKIKFDDDYDILMNIFDNENVVISVLSRMDEYNNDKKIMIKILLNINKMLKLKDL